MRGALVAVAISHPSQKGVGDWAAEPHTLLRRVANGPATGAWPLVPASDET